MAKHNELTLAAGAPPWAQSQSCWGECRLCCGLIAVCTGSALGASALQCCAECAHWAWGTVGLTAWQTSGPECTVLVP